MQTTTTTSLGTAGTITDTVLHKYTHSRETECKEAALTGTISCRHFEFVFAFFFGQMREKKLAIIE